MSRFEIKIAGLGGQGIVLASVIVGTAASLHSGKNAAQVQSYGPEARGGACKAEVVISDEAIDYPKVKRPDVLAVMSQEAYDRYVHEVKPGGILILDPDMIMETRPQENARVYPVPATRMAERLGRKIVANMVMVGALTAVAEPLKMEAIEKAIADRVPRGTEKLNIEASKQGYEYVKRLLDEEKHAHRVGEAQ